MAPTLNEIAPGVAGLTLTIANVYFVGRPGAAWVLIDTALRGKARQIREAAEARFGPGAKPEAILLTHGHGDHSGSALDLAREWDVPICVHPLELPYLTGERPYPAADLTVGGFMCLLARVMPARPVHLADRVKPFEAGREAPGLPGWELAHTPGHSPGHVAFFRREDGVLISGDAVVTANLDSFFDVLTRKQQISRPPAPFTPDWAAARESVRQLAALRPITLASGHGVPMTGEHVARELAEFAENFAIPERGRYAKAAAI
jgi:glyoxylase-like metal-dependent hydrolase (beta-lactamase superfamily II)